MTDTAKDDTLTAPTAPQKSDSEVPDQQLDGVAGGAGRPIQDCEGTTFMTSKLLGRNAAASDTLKSE
jgi:hypothetical protein